MVQRITVLEEVTVKISVIGVKVRAAEFLNIASFGKGAGGEISRSMLSCRVQIFIMSCMAGDFCDQLCVHVHACVINYLRLVAAKDIGGLVESGVQVSDSRRRVEYCRDCNDKPGVDPLRSAVLSNVSPANHSYTTAIC